MTAKRDVSPMLQLLRNFLQKRKNVNFLRFRDEMAPRTQPQPNLPKGPHQVLATNYYYTRDARRSVEPEKIVFEGSTVTKLGSGQGEVAQAVLKRTPGKVHQWDL